jgi:hypothetical protein
MEKKKNFNYTKGLSFIFDWMVKLKRKINLVEGPKK